MAALAGHGRVATIEDESGTEVIKCRLCEHIVRTQQHDQDRRRKNETRQQCPDAVARCPFKRDVIHCSDRTSLNESAE